MSGNLTEAGLRVNAETTYPPRRVTIIVPSRVRCGIAQYARDLAVVMRARRIDCRLVAPGLPLTRHLEEEKPAGAGESFSIQHHPAFYPFKVLAGIVERTSAHGPVCITLHHSELPGPSQLKDLYESGARFIVHTRRAQQRLTQLGVPEVFRIPMGVPVLRDRAPDPARPHGKAMGRPVIGICGFLRPHKGLAELISAMPALLGEHPRAFLMALMPLCPLRESAGYHETCKSLIGSLGLHGRVLIDTDFLGRDLLIRRLQSADLVVLPNDTSTEGASAAARYALAARRPVLTSNSAIFSDLSGVVHTMQGREPGLLAEDIKAVLGSRRLMESLTRRSAAYAEENSWHEAGAKMLRILYQLPPGGQSP